MRRIIQRIKERYSDGTLWTTLLNSGPFQKEPKNKTDCYSSTHIHKGTAYHQAFTAFPGRKLLWELEQDALYKIIQEKKSFKKHLDFAGGTGRIAKVLEEFSNQQYILDISTEMLAVAKENLSQATIICADFRDNPAELNEVVFDMVTAFRFFPNAEPALRESAMQFITRKLVKGGWLVCNNHRNFWSFPYFASRLTYSGGSVGMSNRQIITLADQCGLALIRTYSMGLLPQTEKKALVPWSITEKMETFAFKFYGTMHKRGYNVIYIFEKR